MTAIKEHVMVGPSGVYSRHCRGTNKRGMPCMALGPWHWSPEQGPWYCFRHKPHGDDSQ